MLRTDRLFEIGQFPPAQRCTDCSFDFDPAFGGELSDAFGECEPGNHSQIIAISDTYPGLTFVFAERNFGGNPAHG